MSKSVYEMVTERIITELEKGNIPWDKPWTGTQSGAYNRITNKPYSLLNQMLLRNNGEYASFKQWSNLGGKIKKGAKSEFVVFWKITEIEDKKADGTIEKKLIPLLRYYNVFHISQVDGVEPKERKTYDIKPVENADKILNDYLTREHIKVEQTASNEAYYSPNRDLIHLPLTEQFKSVEGYYETFIHESIHSTGHSSRLNRLHTGINASFGSETYSKEELCAELGSAFLMNMLGIETDKSFRNASSYIQGWLEVLRNDNRFIISASSKAEKAVEYILNVKSIA